MEIQEATWEDTNSIIGAAPVFYMQVCSYELDLASFPWLDWKPEDWQIDRRWFLRKKEKRISGIFVKIDPHLRGTIFSLLRYSWPSLKISASANGLCIWSRWVLYLDWSRIDSTVFCPPLALGRDLSRPTMMRLHFTWKYAHTTSI